MNLPYRAAFRYMLIMMLLSDYLKELITYNNVSGSRLPSLHTPTYKLSKAEFGFMNYAPRLWNSLPKDVKQSDNVNILKNKLKTHLFSRSHPV